VVIPAVIAVLVVLGLVAGQQGWLTGSGSISGNPPTAVASRQTEDPTESATPGSSPTDGATSTDGDSGDSSGAGGSTDSAAQDALGDCRAKVEATDKVLKAAKVGVRHWAEHVQAQTDANSGKISTDTMDAIFKRTRLAGPKDVEKYQDAVQDAKDEHGSCDTPDGTPAPIAARFTDCAEREQAQQHVVDAAAEAMDDWESHLAAMRRSRMGHVHDAQGVWIRAWRAAPPHISAYRKASADFHAPSC
jgi:hypothetical protein